MKGDPVKDTRTLGDENSDAVKKLRRIFIIYFLIGIILFLIGFGAIILKMGPIVNSKNAQELQDDWNDETMSYRTYKIGEKISMFGKIIEVIETKNFEDNELNRTKENLTLKYGGKYIYIFDGNLEVVSNEKIGNSGDYLLMECEVIEFEDIEQNSVQQTLRARSHENPMPFIFLGVVIIIIGCVFFILGFRTRKKFARESSETYKVSKIYRDSGKSTDGEDELYSYLQGKTKGEKNSKTKTPENDQTKFPNQKRHIIIKQPIDLSKNKQRPIIAHQSPGKRKSVKSIKDYENDYQMIKKVYRSMKSEDEKKKE